MHDSAPTRIGEQFDDRSATHVPKPEGSLTTPAPVASLGSAIAGAQRAPGPTVRRDPSPRVRRSLAVWDPAVTDTSRYGDAVIGTEHNADDMAARLLALPDVGGITHDAFQALSAAQVRTLASGLAVGFPGEMELSYYSDPTGAESTWIVKLWGTITTYEWKDQAIAAFLDGITDSTVLEMTGADQEIAAGPAPEVEWTEVSKNIFCRIDLNADPVKRLHAATLALFVSAMAKGTIAEKGTGQDGVKWQHDPPQIKVRRTKLEPLGEPGDLRVSGTKKKQPDGSWRIVFNDVTSGH